jgi:hypothetical protein
MDRVSPGGREAAHDAIVSRRIALRGAAAGASLVWVAPLVQTVSLESASAVSTPPPIKPPAPPPDKPPAPPPIKPPAPPPPKP